MQFTYERFRNLVDKLELDVLMIDTHPGWNEETFACPISSKT
jgi:MinD-like ATPase involved in chromosome partitioning or flagellar assembly